MRESAERAQMVVVVEEGAALIRVRPCCRLSRRE